MKLGKLVVFTGPSGVGKGTLEKEFINEEEFNFHFTVSATTREIRNDEIDGEHHWFISKSKFIKWIEENKFLEYATYINNYYGTLKNEVQEKISEGRNVFLEIELEGAKQVISKMPNAISIFVLPPSVSELDKRLKNRGTENDVTINARIKRAREEIEFVKSNKLFKYTVINDDVKKCSNEIKVIIKKELNV